MQLDEVRWIASSLVPAGAPLWSLRGLTPIPEVWEQVACEITDRVNRDALQRWTALKTMRDGILLKDPAALRWMNNEYAHGRDFAVRNVMEVDPTPPALQNAPDSLTAVFFTRMSHCVACGELCAVAYGGPRRVYCSDRCGVPAEAAIKAEQAARMKRRRSEKAAAKAAARTVECERCATAFTPRRSTARFCSTSCRVSANRSAGTSTFETGETK